MTEIKTLENELGRPVLAFSCHPVTPARISAVEPAKIQALETKLGLSLVAVNG